MLYHPVHRFKSRWWQLLLFIVAALVMAATFMAYFSAEGLVGFADLLMC